MLEWITVEIIKRNKMKPKIKHVNMINTIQSNYQKTISRDFCL